MRGAYSGQALRDETRRLWAARHVPSYGYGEVRPLRPLLSRTEGLVALDVGANKGFWTKAFLNNFPGQVAHVHMFDPSPENFAELTNRDDNLLFEPADFAHVTAHNVAVGAASGEAVLYTNEDGSPLASLHPHTASGGAGRFGESLDKILTVPVVALDDFLAEHGIEHVDVLKIDVEGHEYAVLQGAESSLREGRVDCLIWEFGIHQVESRRFFLDYWELLTGLGFELYEIPNVTARRIERYDHRFEVFTSDAMFVARRRAAPRQGPPAGFEEAAYLAANPDVKAAMERGEFDSGLHHWLQFGYRENRAFSPG